MLAEQYPNEFLVARYIIAVPFIAFMKPADQHSGIGNNILNS